MLVAHCLQPYITFHLWAVFPARGCPEKISETKNLGESLAKKFKRYAYQIRIQLSGARTLYAYTYTYTYETITYETITYETITYETYETCVHFGQQRWQPLVRGTRSCRGTGICMSLTRHRCQLAGISGIWQCFGVSGRQQVMRQFVCLSVCLCLDMAVADLCLLPIACSHISHFTYGQCFRQEDAPKKYLKQRIWGNPSQKNQ